MCLTTPHPRTGGGISGGLCSVLPAMVSSAITPIPPLAVVVLWPGAAPSDPLRDLAYHDLCDSV
jgi:hypothetical protein